MIISQMYFFIAHNVMITIFHERNEWKYDASICSPILVVWLVRLPALVLDFQSFGAWCCQAGNIQTHDPPSSRLWRDKSQVGILIMAPCFEPYAVASRRPGLKSDIVTLYKVWLYYQRNNRAIFVTTCTMASASPLPFLAGGESGSRGFSPRLPHHRTYGSVSRRFSS